MPLNFPWVESPFFDLELPEKKLSAGQLAIVKEYHQNGYVVIPGMVPQTIIDDVKKDAEEKAFNPDFKMDLTREGGRVQDFWKISQPTAHLAAYPALLEILELLYGREAIPFQTLSFKFGTQQRAHSDTIHFSSLPARFMCGVWVALEDITAENGPVFYYPGSQRLPEYNFSHIKPNLGTTSYTDYPEYEDFIEKIVAVNKLEKKQFLAKKGDLLIWSSNIIHGGSPVTKEGATRWSQVTHYFFKDCLYYTPMLSDMVTGEYHLKRKLRNIKTNETVVLTYNGAPVNVKRTRKYLFTLADNVIGKPRMVLKMQELTKRWFK